MTTLTATLCRLFPAGKVKQNEVPGRNDTVENLQCNAEPQDCEVLVRSETRRAANRRTFYLVRAGDVLVYLCIYNFGINRALAAIFNSAPYGTTAADELTAFVTSALPTGMLHTA